MPGKISDQFVIGVDFGTDSVRSLIVDSKNGSEIASAVFTYPRWRDGLYCDASRNQFRQHPLDYIEGIEQIIKSSIRQAGTGAANAIKAISIDTTGSTPAAVNEQGVPLALLPGYEQNPNAMFVLWKDHTAIMEAAEINSKAGNYLKYCGGIYSSEWFWAKLLQILRADKQVEKACYSFVEHCDWMPFLLTGGTNAMNIKRSRCAAGHKALWSAEWGGFPKEFFLSGLDYRLKGFADSMSKRTYTTDEPAGFLSAEWAERVGLSKQVVIGIGALDAHVGAVGGQIEPYYLSKVMGTSTCDILVVPKEEMDNQLIKGICGQVEGSVIPGMTGLEAGQSAFGDTYAWFRDLLNWPLTELLKKSKVLGPGIAELVQREIAEMILPELSQKAAFLPHSEQAELALDWLNGRRTPDANQQLTGTISGLNLGSNAPRIYRSLAEATCFGARSIVERFETEGIGLKGVIGLGGVAKKSPYIMQLMADVLQMPIRVHKNLNTCTLGAAMFAATAYGVYPKVEDAMRAMGSGFDRVYTPDHGTAEFYEKRYQRYRALGEFAERET